MDYFPVFPVMVGSTYDKLDTDGIAGVDSGMGNHSVHADSVMKHTKYGWIVRQPNTWGTAWGREGCCYLRKEHVTRTFSAGAGFAVKMAQTDPESPDHPPAQK